MELAGRAGDLPGPFRGCTTRFRKTIMFAIDYAEGVVEEIL
jgi:hypothetical protein